MDESSVSVVDKGPFVTQFERDLGRYVLALLCRDRQLTPELERKAREKGYGRIVDEAKRDPVGAAALYKRELDVAVEQLIQADPEGVAGNRYPYLIASAGLDGPRIEVMPYLDTMETMPSAVSDDPVHRDFEKIGAARDDWAKRRDSLVRP